MPSALRPRRGAMPRAVGNHSTNILPARDPMFVPPRGEGRVPQAAGSRGGVDTDPGDVVTEAVTRLGAPGLVVLAGPPGIGRTGALRRLAAAFRGPVFTGG